MYHTTIEYVIRVTAMQVCFLNNDSSHRKEAVTDSYKVNACST